MVNLSIRQYPNEHYSTVFNARTGFFIRKEEPGYSEPFWSAHGPELIDISITNWCDKNCNFCYRSSNKSGMHMALADYEMIMRQAKEMQVMQVALGGGNPNQHPDFCQILELTRDVYGIVPSYTTNGRGLSKEVIAASAKFCGAVAVSAYSPFDETILAIAKLADSGIKTNIHFVLDKDSINIAINWLSDPPDFLERINAIVFLNYKPVGRNPNSDKLLKHSNKSAVFWKLVSETKHNYKIGFDSCLVSGIASFTDTNKVFYDSCEAGRFSMFISENMKAYPCSFMESSFQGNQITENNLFDIWQKGALFRNMREVLSNNQCSFCLRFSICRGGCPIFSQINLCPE